MDLAFVGQWSTVRGSHDGSAWSNAAGKVGTEIVEFVGSRAIGNLYDAREERRKTTFNASFEDLGIGLVNKRVSWLYLSLAVFPDGRAFAVRIP